VLEQVTQAERPLTVKVIARRCGLNLSTAYHLVRTLSYEGYLVRQPDHTYAVGPEVAERFHELVGSFGRPPAAGAVLRHLAVAGGHTAYLARLTADRMVIVDVVEGPRSPWLEDLQVGLDTAVHATALGKALLTTVPRQRRRRMLTAQGLRRFTARTPTEPDDVEAAVHHLRPGDLVVEHGEFRDGVACAGLVARTGDPAGWWAIGVSTRGLELPPVLLAHLRRAGADLAVPAP
jgi:DNA-binding IclR family transcriptional regulator